MAGALQHWWLQGSDEASRGEKIFLQSQGLYMDAINENWCHTREEEAVVKGWRCPKVAIGEYLWWKEMKTTLVDN